jgi:16S rRNA (guanine527-N7)-methyltransferase
MDVILDYFPDLTPLQIAQFEKLGVLYKEWNSKINVVSRKDIDNIYAHHILHSMAIAKVFEFKDGASVLDLGTGGGLPGIPLAILFPKVQFLLVDSIGKKIKVTQEIAKGLSLDNVRAQQIRAESLQQSFDFVVTRAVAVLPQLMTWIKGRTKKKNRHSVPNGLWALKGTDRAAEEVQQLGKSINSDIFPLSNYFGEAFFETKCVVYVQA